MSPVHTVVAAMTVATWRSAALRARQRATVFPQARPSGVGSEAWFRTHRSSDAFASRSSRTSRDAGREPPPPPGFWIFDPRRSGLRDGLLLRDRDADARRPRRSLDARDERRILQLRGVLSGGVLSGGVLSAESSPRSGVVWAAFFRAAP